MAVNDRKYVFHFRPKPKLEKGAGKTSGLRQNTETVSVPIFTYICTSGFGILPKARWCVGGILLQFNVSNDLSN